MRNIKPLLLMFVFMMFMVNLSAAPVIIKLASIAPERSPWGVVLERLASEWKKITKGEVVLRIYHNGVAGTEEDILAKARLNQLQAGVITASGLSNLSPEVLALSIPFLIKDEAELDRALAGTADYMAEKISEKGFTVLAWSKVGWINFFSKKEVRTPDDLRATKLAGGVSSDTMVNAFKQLGFQIFPVPSNEVITALNSGMVESFYSSPLGAAGFQWFAKAPYLLDLRVCPFVGVMVVNSRTWARVPVKYREVLIRRTEELIKELDGEIDNLERQAIEVMKQNGLTVVHATAEEEALWREDMLNSSKKTIGTVFPLEMYQRILQALGRAE